jgi:hypothetical protein
MSHWVDELSGCPGAGGFRQLADEAEPGRVLFRHRSGGSGIVDGFVREGVDELMMVARFRGGQRRALDGGAGGTGAGRNGSPPPGEGRGH